MHWKDWCWSWNSNTLATWCEELIDMKRPWCRERLKAGGEGDNRGWDGWMASLTRWTWIWVNSVSWWWTGNPGVPQSMGSQRVGHDRVTELNWDKSPAGLHSLLLDSLRLFSFWFAPKGHHWGWLLEKGYNDPQEKDLPWPRKEEKWRWWRDEWMDVNCIRAGDEDVRNWWHDSRDCSSGILTLSKIPMSIQNGKSLWGLHGSSL